MPCAAERRGRAGASPRWCIAPHRDVLVVVAKYGRGDRRSGAGQYRRESQFHGSFGGGEPATPRDGPDRPALHRRGRPGYPESEILRELDDLVRAGKVLDSGFSTYPCLVPGARRIARRPRPPGAEAHRGDPGRVRGSPASSRVGSRRWQTPAGPGIVRFSPLAGGLLTGKYRQGASKQAGGPAPMQRRRCTRSSGGTRSSFSEVLAVAAESGASLSQIALARMRRTDLLLLIGPRSPAQLVDNFRRADPATGRGAAQAVRPNLRRSPRYLFPHELVPQQRPAGDQHRQSARAADRPVL